MSNKIVLIDGNSIFYRAFFALPMLKNDKGEISNAIYGFANILVKAIIDIKPTHIAVAFDVSRHTFRNDIYAEYKGTRKPMPDELRSQIIPLKKMLKTMGICMLEKEGLEADDIIGTIAKRFNDETIIITGDRDALQLISPSTTIYLTQKGISDIKIMNEKSLLETWQIEPWQVTELKALQGDTADNIPGVVGIGEVTAKKLISEYKSLSGVYSNIENITGKLKEKLVQGKAMADISLLLGTINQDIDIECSLKDMEYIFPFNKETHEFMQDYNFRSLLKRTDIFQANEDFEQQVFAESINIINYADMIACLQKCENAKILAFEIGENEIHFSDGKSDYVINIKLDLLSASLTDKDFFKESKKFIENKEITKIVFDSKWTMHFLENYEICMNNYFDVSIAVHLVDGLSIKDFSSVASKHMTDNNALALCTLKVDLEKQLNKLSMTELYYKVELPLTKVLFDMEVHGFKVDVNKLEELGEKYKNELSLLTTKIYKEAGHEFNINSPKQISEVLFNELNLKHNKKMSTDVERLEEIQNDHEIVPLILRFRKLAKLNNTYIDGLKQHLDKNNFIHTTFKQTLTTTGRLSSTEPNLQNIPIRSDESREIRSMFVASDEDSVLIDADYSQIELRLLAHFSQDENLLYAFSHGHDIHTQTASKVFGISEELVTKEMRRIAKIVNFGIIYGISDFGLASDIKTSTWKAKEYITTYFNVHPKVRKFMDDIVRDAKDTGSVSTILGRTRNMVDITASNYLVRSRAERAAQNMPLQGSAADIIKLAMIGVSSSIISHKLKAKLIMQVHDELIIDCPINEELIVTEIVEKEMVNAIKLSVPLTVDICSSYRWSEGH
ncbi:MAG: DNA polymerase I [Clostridia bacterium]